MSEPRCYLHQLWLENVSQEPKDSVLISLILASEMRISITQFDMTEKRKIY